MTRSDIIRVFGILVGGSGVSNLRTASLHVVCSYYCAMGHKKVHELDGGV